jgi:hypothetical protein
MKGRTDMPGVFPDRPRKSGGASVSTLEERDSTEVAMHVCVLHGAG